MAYSCDSLLMIKCISPQDFFLALVEGLFYGAILNEIKRVKNM